MSKAARSLAVAALALVCLEASAAGPPFARNTGAHPAHSPIVQGQNVAGGGLGPTTWGFAANYSGTLYGTGYYAFQVNRTYSGSNSIFGYTYSYPTFGFVNDVRAIYAFDVSSLGGLPSPVWSSFLFDTRERPSPGSEGVSVFAAIQLASTGGTHHLQGLSLFQGNNAANLDIYDAEDFENAAPFDNPELAFSGSGQTLIGSVSVSPSGAPIPIDFDVTAAVLNDLGPGGPTGPPVVEVPALDTLGLAALALLLGLAGAVFLRR